MTAVAHESIPPLSALDKAQPRNCFSIPERKKKASQRRPASQGKLDWSNGRQIGARVFTVDNPITIMLGPAQFLLLEHGS